MIALFLCFAPTSTLRGNPEQGFLSPKDTPIFVVNSLLLKKLFFAFLLHDPRGAPSQYENSEKGHLLPSITIAYFRPYREFGSSRNTGCRDLYLHKRSTLPGQRFHWYSPNPPVGLLSSGPCSPPSRILPTIR